MRSRSLVVVLTIVAVLAAAMAYARYAGYRLMPIVRVIHGHR